MQSEWYKATSLNIDALRQQLLPREVKEYQLDKLQGIARRVDEFASVDPVCQGYRQEIDRMVAELPGAPLPNDRNKVYMWNVGAMINHLKKAHKLVNEGEYLGMGLVIGLILGGVVGLFIGTTPVATGVGIVVGLVIGMALDARVKKEGRVI
jgi:hypothetical protein